MNLSRHGLEFFLRIERGIGCLEFQAFNVGEGVSQLLNVPETVCLVSDNDVDL